MGVRRRALYVFVAGFLVDFIGFVFHLVGMTTTEWSTLDNDNTYGVFRTCVGGSCSMNTDPAIDLQTAMALTVIAIVLIMIAIIVALIHIVLEVLEGEPIKFLPLMAGCLSIGAFFINLIGWIVWGAVIHADLTDANSSWEIGYSLPLSIVGGLLMLLGGVLLLLGDTFICTSDRKKLPK